MVGIDVKAVVESVWRSMARGHGLQKPVWPGLEEKVLREFRVIYDRLEEARPLLGGQDTADGGLQPRR